MGRELVRQYYAALGEREWERLDSPGGILEFEVTRHALRTHLPPAGRVLDLGGGPGRYTIWLARQGYQVVLADLSPELLAIARDKVAETGVAAQVEAIVACDACDLSRFEDGSFDALLCLGPFYHLVEAADREAAAWELVRVLRPGGVAFVAFMPIYAFLGRTLAYPDERHHLADPDFVRRLLDEGVFLNDVPGRFTAGYGIHPQAVSPFFEARGLRTLDLLSDTGFAAPVSQVLPELAASDPLTYKATVQLVLDTAGDPCLLGAGTHLLYVGRKGP